MNTIKQLPNLEEISTQQATCLKGGLTDTRTGILKSPRSVIPAPTVK